jgi:hypothetical protein
MQVRFKLEKETKGVLRYQEVAPEKVSFGFLMRGSALGLTSG